MPRRLTTRLLGRQTVAVATLDLRFERLEPEPFEFAPGQFVTLAAGKDAAGKDLRRSYSLASASGDPVGIRLIIKEVPGGVASELFSAMPVGTTLAMTGPHGFFVLDADHAGDVVFAVTGTGIAPVLPMLGALSRQPRTGQRTVHWGLRSRADIFLRDEIESAVAAAGATLHLTLSRPEPGWNGPTGRITGAVLSEAPRLSRPTFYLAGNGAMVAEVSYGLRATGIDRKRQLRTEPFFEKP